MKLKVEVPNFKGNVGNECKAYIYIYTLVMCTQIECTYREPIIHDKVMQLSNIIKEC